MGLIIDIAAGQRNASPKLTQEELSRVYKETIDRAYEKLEPKDRAVIKDLVIELAERKKIRNFGEGSAREILMTIGILMADMPERDFDRYVLSRYRYEEEEDD